MKEVEIGSPRNAELRDAFHSLARDKAFRASKLSPEKIIEEIGRRRFDWTIEERELSLLNQERKVVGNKELTREARNARRRLDYRNNRLAKLESKYNFFTEIQEFAPQPAEVSTPEESLIPEYTDAPVEISYALALRDKTSTALALLPPQVLRTNGHDKSAEVALVKLGSIIEVADSTKAPVRRSTREVFDELRSKTDSILSDDEIPVFKVSPRRNGHSQILPTVVSEVTEEPANVEPITIGLPWISTRKPLLQKESIELDSSGKVVVQEDPDSEIIKKLQERLDNFPGSPTAKAAFYQGILRVNEAAGRLLNPHLNVGTGQGNLLPPTITGENNGIGYPEPPVVSRVLIDQSEKPEVDISFKTPSGVLNSYNRKSRSLEEVIERLTFAEMQRLKRSGDKDSEKQDPTYLPLELTEEEEWRRRLELEKTKTKLLNVIANAQRPSILERLTSRAAALFAAVIR